ncbi:GAF domain-containing protein [Microseira wollei]|uniref:histidine kinase n=1 Tax=Microseira wollei NIES-4236 TaxID=2530354 RepID=A0AAV3X8F8_9CYAN|nr:GAF domain-containing protein [Microseira wollei]GET36926.1 multi-sensor signal transduction histidine kinase [Microseira wollei NIES-4236]
MNLSNLQDPQLSLEPENLLRRIANIIRRSLEIEEILSATAAEVRRFLATDRVKIYKFHPDGSGQVIAESIRDRILPSLLGLNFPADDIPLSSRQLFIEARVRSIVDVNSRQLGQSLLRDPETGKLVRDDIRYRSVDACHVEYLTAMGVKSSLALPIFHRDQLWGLLVSHHAQPRSFLEPELQVVQMVVDQLSVAIAQSILLASAREQAQREITINRVAPRIDSLSGLDLQGALEEIVPSLAGSGGRLYINSLANTGEFPITNSQLPITNPQDVEIYTCGPQPVMPEQAKFNLIEQYSVWQEHFKPGGEQAWAISDLYRVPSLRTLQPAFRATQIRGILIVPLWHSQQLLGYLSVFRDEIETETLWAGQFDPDGRQVQPRLSFEVWRESQKGQAREWTEAEIELAVSLARCLTNAIQQYIKHQQLKALNANLEEKVQASAAKLQLAVEQQQIFYGVVAKIRESLDLDTIFTTTAREIRCCLNADRVGIFRFDPSSNFTRGEFIAESVLPTWPGILGERIRDRFLGEQAIGYQKGQIQVNKGVSEYPAKYQIAAQIIVPLFKGYELWGLLCIHQCSSTREWQANEVQFAAKMALALGVAVGQAELLEVSQQQAIALQQAAEQQWALLEVVAKIRESLDLEKVFEISTQEVCKSLQADRVAVYRFNSNWGGEFVAEYVAPGWVKLVGENIKTIVEDTYLQETAGGRYRHNETHWVDDIYQANLSECHIAILEQFQAKAYAIAPIKVGQQLWGLLAAYQNSVPRHWEPEQIKFITQMGSQLGVAIKQSELLAQTRQQTTDLRRATERQRVLFEVVAKIRETLDLNAIFKATAKEVRRSLNADRVAMFQFDPNSGYDTGVFVSEDVLPEFSSALEAPVYDHCFGEQYAIHYHQGRVQAVSDIYTAGLQDCHRDVLAQFQIRANLVVPLMKGGDLWGLLCIHQCAFPRNWETEEIQFVKQIALQLGVALQQAELLALSQQQAEQISQTLRDLQDTQTQLIQTEKMSSLGQLVAGIAHEINNPVNFIYGNIAYVREYAESLLNLLELYQQHYPNPALEIQDLADAIDVKFIAEDLPKLLSSMKMGTERIRQLVLSLRNFSRLDEADMKPVNIHEGLESTLLILQPRLKAKPDSPNIEIVKEYGELPQVECYAGQLNQVFMNVLNNAIDALEQSAVNQEITDTPTIRIQTFVFEESAVICISDNGSGMPEAVKARIFDPFFTTKPVGKGTGLGLSISYQIVVNKHCGVFKCTSEPGKGTQFWIEIPIKAN